MCALTIEDYTKGWEWKKISAIKFGKEISKTTFLQNYIVSQKIIFSFTYKLRTF